MKRSIIGLLLLQFFMSHAVAQTLLHQVDSVLSKRYNTSKIDSAYVMRPKTKWTIRARLNVSGQKIETNGREHDGRFFESEMKADYKTTVSVGVSYMGISVNLALNPAKLSGKYHDFELNFSSYGKRFGFEVMYQDAKNFKGWYEMDGRERFDLPADILKVKTLNVNAYYVFNHRRFSYPAAFSQSYIQKHSAGSFLLAAAAQGQRGHVNGEDHEMHFKMTNIGIGGGYGYNCVPHRGWLLHISALPTFIFYSHSSLTYDDARVPLHYHFPEFIITGRGAVVKQWGNKFFGISGVYHFTNIGHEKNLAAHNTKWLARAFIGFRL